MNQIFTGLVTITFAVLSTMAMKAETKRVGPFQITTASGSVKDACNWKSDIPTEENYHSGLLEIKSTTQITITSIKTTASVTIRIDTLGANIVLAGVQFERHGTHMGAIQTNNDATITLKEGTTNILGGPTGCGICIEGGVLTIKGDGKLIAKGAYDENVEEINQPSAILSFNPYSYIVVAGGTIEATSRAKNAIDAKLEVNGDAFITTKGVLPAGSTLTKGIVIEGKKGTIYGTPVISSIDAEVPDSTTLTIEANQQLKIKEGVTLTNNGTILVKDGATYDNARIKNNGVITGRPTNNLEIEGSVKVQAIGSVLHLYLPQDGQVAIYTLSGLLYKEQRLPAGNTELELAPGIYLVKIGGTTHKVVIR